VIAAVKVTISTPQGLGAEDAHLRLAIPLIALIVLGLIERTAAPILRALLAPGTPRGAVA
jgi:hypothetical protein